MEAMYKQIEMKNREYNIQFTSIIKQKIEIKWYIRDLSGSAKPGLSLLLKKFSSLSIPLKNLLMDAHRTVIIHSRALIKSYTIFLRGDD